MTKLVPRTYSVQARSAASLLGGLIRAARKERKLTAQDVADRAGISRGLLQRIEKGDLKAGLGAVFEVAVIVGVRLFDMDEAGLRAHVQHTQDKLTLLPKSVRKKARMIVDDF